MFPQKSKEDFITPSGWCHFSTWQVFLVLIDISMGLHYIKMSAVVQDTSVHRKLKMLMCKIRLHFKTQQEKGDNVSFINVKMHKDSRCRSFP